MALTGRSGVPVVKASTSKLFQPKTRSAGVSSASPQSRSIVGPFPPPSTSTPASTRRTAAGSGGRHSGTRIVDEKFAAVEIGVGAGGGGGAAHIFTLFRRMLELLPVGHYRPPPI